MTIYEKIKQLCLNKGITITKLEELCQLSQNSIKKWDKRDSLPSGVTIIKIAAYFNVSTDYLLGLPIPEYQELYNSLTDYDKVNACNYMRGLRDGNKTIQTQQPSQEIGTTKIGISKKV